jgi:thiol:disulfide interchange protein DsbD
VSNRLLIFILFLPFILLGQVKESPLKWSYAPSKTDVKIGEEIELIFTATIEDGWYSYSKGPFESAPEASFTFEKNPTYQLIGEIKPIHDKKKIDEYLGEYRYFVGKAEFRQRVKILSENPQIKVVFEYYSCSLESGKCLPPFEEETIFSGLKAVGKIEQTTSSEKLNIATPNEGIVPKEKVSTKIIKIDNLDSKTLQGLNNRLNEKYNKINSTIPYLPSF